MATPTFVIMMEKPHLQVCVFVWRYLFTNRSMRERNAAPKLNKERWAKTFHRFHDRSTLSKNGAKKNFTSGPHNTFNSPEKQFRNCVLQNNGVKKPSQLVRSTVSLSFIYKILQTTTAAKSSHMSSKPRAQSVLSPLLIFLQ